MDFPIKTSIIIISYNKPVIRIVPKSSKGVVINKSI